jgi:hypothetical protein
MAGEEWFKVTEIEIFEIINHGSDHLTTMS